MELPPSGSVQLPPTSTGTAGPGPTGPAKPDGNTGKTGEVTKVADSSALKQVDSTKVSAGQVKTKPTPGMKQHASKQLLSKSTEVSDPEGGSIQPHHGRANPALTGQGDSGQEGGSDGSSGQTQQALSDDAAEVPTAEAQISQNLAEAGLPQPKHLEVPGAIPESDATQAKVGELEQTLEAQHEAVAALGADLPAAQEKAKALKADVEALDKQIQDTSSMIGQLRARSAEALEQDQARKQAFREKANPETQGQKPVDTSRIQPLSDKQEGELGALESQLSDLHESLQIAVTKQREAAAEAEQIAENKVRGQEEIKDLEKALTNTKAEAVERSVDAKQDRDEALEQEKVQAQQQAQQDSRVA